MGIRNPYYKWTLFDLLDHAKNTEDKIHELEATVMSFGLASKDERKNLAELKRQLAFMNQEINDKTK